MSRPGADRMPETFKNFIGGQWVAPATGAYFENRNPASWDEVIGCFPRSGPQDVPRAVAPARRGSGRGSRTPAPAPGRRLQRVATVLARPHAGSAPAVPRG